MSPKYSEGSDPVLTDIIAALRDKIWLPLFDIRQYDTGQDLLNAVSQKNYISFFTQNPDDKEFTNLQAQGKVPFDFALDGIAMHIASNDRYYDVANGHIYTIKGIFREHGRIYAVANGNYELCNDKAWAFPAAGGFSSAVSTTQTLTELVTQAEGHPSVMNYYRPGGTDPNQGVILPKNTTIRLEWSLDAKGLALLNTMFPTEDPPASLSALGFQATCRFLGYQAREFQP